jgi:hypothetical protein
MTLARSKKILKSAKGENCTLRLVGICNFNSETTVAAHIGRSRGMGIKCSDICIVYACSNCHREIDSHSRSTYADDINRAWEETLEKLVDKELISLR